MVVDDVAAGAAPKSPPGFEPNRPPPAVGVVGAAPNNNVEPFDPPGVPGAAGAAVFGAPNRFGVDALVVFVAAGAAPKRPPLGLVAGCPKKLGVAAGWVVVVELAGWVAAPPKREPVFVAAGFAPNRPPPPRAFPPPSEGDEVAPKRPPEGVAGLSALCVVESAGLGCAPKEKPPVAGAGEPVADHYVRGVLHQIITTYVVEPQTQIRRHRSYSIRKVHLVYWGLLEYPRLLEFRLVYSS